MKRLQELAENYLNGMMTAKEYANYTAYTITEIAEKDIDTLAFLISYGEMPDVELAVDHKEG